MSFILGLLSRKGVHHALQHPVYGGKAGSGTDLAGAGAVAVPLVAESLRGGYFEALLVLCVSMLAAGISSAVLGSFMCSLVVLCRRYRINPGTRALLFAGC